ncbi:MAG: hypothetical protein ACI832_002032, partial [Rheinheimera aquimaris]
TASTNFATQALRGLFLSVSSVATDLYKTLQAFLRALISLTLNYSKS